MKFSFGLNSMSESVIDFPFDVSIVLDVSLSFEGSVVVDEVRDDGCC